jgi:hypothetical protein
MTQYWKLGLALSLSLLATSACNTFTGANSPTQLSVAEANRIAAVGEEKQVRVGGWFNWGVEGCGLNAQPGNGNGPRPFRA